MAEKDNTSTNSKKGKKKDAVYIIIIILLLLVGGYLGLEIRDGKKQLIACGESVTNLTAEKDYLNDVLKKSGIIQESDNETLEANLQSLLSQYDSLEIDNEAMLDSVNKQKAHIQDLLTEVETLKSQKKRDWGKIYKLKKETETLREIMKGYIHTIDSLNTVNIGLKEVIKDKDTQITKIESEKEKIKDQNELLNETVALGSVLQTSGLIANAIKIKSSGKQVETTRAKRADMIKACFTLLENKIAEEGNKEVYMRIISPEGKDLTNASPVTIETNDGRVINTSVVRQVNYQNKNMDLCIYYEFEAELLEGTYIVEIYVEGYKIGKTSFALK